MRRCRGDVFKLLLFLKTKNERSMKKIIAMFAILVIAKMASAQAVVATIITDVDDAGIIESHKAITQQAGTVPANFIWVMVEIPSRNMVARALMNVNKIHLVSSGGVHKGSTVMVELVTHIVATPKVPELAAKPIMAVVID